MARRYSLLVIDDEWGIREGTYKAAFENDRHFALHWVNEPAELEEKMEIRPDGYLLDIVLDQGTWGRERWTAEKVIDEYLSKHKRSPVFLVSSKWAKPDDTLEAVNAIMSRHREIVRDFFDWSWFSIGKSTDPDNDPTSAVKGKLRVELDSWHRRSAYEPDEKKPLRILHISDLQFGDPVTTEEAFQSEKVIADTVFNARPKKIPDFIVVTGDIAYSGAPSEYDKAATWIDNALRKRLWPHVGSIDRERLLVVPGNHDVNLRLCLADHIDYDFDKHKKGTRDLPTKRRDGDAREDLKHYGLDPFLRFAEQVSEGGLSRDNAHHSWVSNRFLHLGIQFVLLNTVAKIDAMNPDRVDLSQDMLDSLSESLDEPDEAKDAFRVLLLHHPYSRDPSSVWTQKANERLNAFLGTNHIDLMLAGHDHGFLTGVLPTSTGVARPGMPYVVTSTLKLGPEARKNDDRRGFVLLELKRDRGGRIKETSGEFFELLPGKTGHKEKFGPYRRLT